ncbi:hypothetical protein Hanom_Chr01g00084901 [Helianthus anomalus]
MSNGNPIGRQSDRMASRPDGNPFGWSSDRVTIRLDCHLVWSIDRTTVRSDDDLFGEVFLREQVHSSVVTRSDGLPIGWQAFRTGNVMNMLKIV